MKGRRTLRRIVSRNDSYRTKVIAELNIHFEDPVSTRTVGHERHKSNIHGRTALAEPLITESIAQMRTRWCGDYKTWTPDSWKRARDVVI
jgi:hypothetical protein